MVQTKKKERKELEEHEPGATRKEVLGALAKVASATNGTKTSGQATPATSSAEKKLIKKAAKHIVKLNRKAFKELERY